MLSTGLDRWKQKNPKKTKKKTKKANKSLGGHKRIAKDQKETESRKLPKPPTRQGGKTIKKSKEKERKKEKRIEVEYYEASV